MSFGSSKSHIRSYSRNAFLNFLKFLFSIKLIEKNEFFAQFETHTCRIKKYFFQLN